MTVSDVAARLSRLSRPQRLRIAARLLEWGDAQLALRIARAVVAELDAYLPKGGADG